MSSERIDVFDNLSLEEIGNLYGLMEKTKLNNHLRDFSGQLLSSSDDFMDLLTEYLGSNHPFIDEEDAIQALEEYINAEPPRLRIFHYMTGRELFGKR